MRSTRFAQVGANGLVTTVEYIHDNVVDCTKVGYAGSLFFTRSNLVLKPWLAVQQDTGYLADLFRLTLCCIRSTALSDLDSHTASLQAHLVTRGRRSHLKTGIKYWKWMNIRPG